MYFYTLNKKKKIGIKDIARNYQPRSKNRLKLRLRANDIAEMDASLIPNERGKNTSTQLCFANLA